MAEGITSEAVQKLMNAALSVIAHDIEKLGFQLEIQNTEARSIRNGVQNLRKLNYRDNESP